MRAVWNYSGNPGFRVSVSSEAPYSPLTLFGPSSTLLPPPFFSSCFLSCSCPPPLPVESVSCFFPQFSGHFQDNLECLPVQGQCMETGYKPGYLPLLQSQKNWAPDTASVTGTNTPWRGVGLTYCPGCCHFLNLWDWVPKPGCGFRNRV